MLKHTEFARNVGAKTARKYRLPIEMDDAIQVAQEGLIVAARRFDMGRFDPSISNLDANFKSYCYPRLVGAVIDQTRKDTFVRRRGLEKGLEFQMLSFDHVNPGFDEPVLQVGDIEADLDLVMDFNAAFDKLSQREQYVVMSLGAGITGREIGAELGVTESRVSQIATAAKDKLKKEMLS